MAFKPECTEPGPGQESVWDYPRPPRLEQVNETLRVVFASETVAETNEGYRVLETSHPPVYYFPPHDVRLDALEPVTGYSACEFKGVAQYWTLDLKGRRSERAAWSYPDPAPAFREIQNCIAF